MASKHDSGVKNLSSGFGDSKFSDILNRLWLTGVDPEKLKLGLATTNNGTNDNTDIIARLLNNGISYDQIKAAQTVNIPQLPGQAWPFTDRQEGKDPQGKPIVVPVHVQPYKADQPNGGVTGVPGLPSATPQIPQTQGQGVPIPQANLPTKNPGIGRDVTIKTAPAGDVKKEPDTSTPGGIAQYEKEHFSSMLWINDVPELAGKLTQAAKEKWSPERFQGEIESTDWWKTHSDTARGYFKLKADPPSFNQAMGLRKDSITAFASQYGITLDEGTVNSLADQALQLGWDSPMLKKQVVNQATFRTDYGGELGQNIGLVKSHGRDFFQTISDQDAFNMAKSMSMGDIDENTVLGNIRQQAKAAWPSLANLIDQGVTPRDAMANQINTAAQLLELDPDQVDPTDPKFSKMISMTDDKGVARPMTVDETTKMVKSMDDYWKTNNAADEVGKKVTSLAQFMGRTV